MFLQLVKVDQCIDRIMPSVTGETEKQRSVCVQFSGVTGKLEQSIAIIILVKITCPIPRKHQGQKNGEGQGQYQKNQYQEHSYYDALSG